MATLLHLYATATCKLQVLPCYCIHASALISCVALPPRDVCSFKKRVDCLYILATGVISTGRRREATCNSVDDGLPPKCCVVAGLSCR